MTFMEWMVKTIREDNALGSWLEEIKYDLHSSFGKFLINSINSSKPILLLCDDKREWLKTYILSSINSSNLNRPLIPLYDISSFKDKFERATSEESREYIKDVLSISFPNGYIIWYIGNGNSALANAPKVLDDSFLWLFDVNMPNALEFSNEDANVDFKLMQTIRLLNTALTGYLYEDFKLQ